MTAAIRILIAQHGDYREPFRFLEVDLPSPTPEEEELARRGWEEAAGLWPGKCLRGLREPMEVFLCMGRELSDEGYRESFVQRVVNRAHASMWGAKVYVVVDQDTEQPVTPLGDAGGPRGGAPRWLDALLRNDVTDVLQWSLRNTAHLSDAVERSAERMGKLITDVPNREWKCVVQQPPNLAPEQKAFLSPYLAESMKKLGGENCLYVVPQARLDNYMKIVRRAIGTKQDRRIVVGVVEQAGSPPGELEEFCRDKGYELVQFHGLAELYYFLRKLNDVNGGGATPVPVVNPHFTTHSPQVLITHSYTADDPRGCLAAANDAWELARDLRRAAKVKIYPAVNCVNLAGLLEELKQVLVWVHIGHGDDVAGLQQSGDGDFRSAADWLKSFASYKSSLALAMFSSCRSAPVAKRFAESGVGVSIGFAYEVHKDACAHLMKKVVRAAVDSNGSQAAILAAFGKGSMHLRAADPAALPVAFWASH